MTAEELETMLQDKTRENLALLERVAKLQDENKEMVMRSLKVFEENAMIKASPEISARTAEMKFELQMAKTFVDSGAFPKGMTPEQAYTVIRAGAEMGLKPVEALNTLYIVNGAISPYGKNMIARLTQEGYRIQYLNEKDGSVDVRVFHPDKDFDVTETATAKDQALRNSKALGFSEKNKLRFHGVRMIINFHLPHLFTSTADFFVEDAQQFDQTQKEARDIAKVEDRKQRQRILDHIDSAKTMEQLEQVRDHIVEYDCIAEYDQKFAALKKSAKAIAAPSIEIAPAAE